MTHVAPLTESRNESKNTLCSAERSSLRMRMLSGAASLALPASVILALGVCMPGDAQAQVSVVQNTTFTLSPAENPFVFGAGTNIDTSAAPADDAVFGAAGTQWIVTNQGTLKSNFHGIALVGTGSSVINSGTISVTSNLVTSAGVYLANGGTVVNQAGGTISGSGADGIEIDGATGSVTNAGTITSDLAAIFLKNNGSVTNQQGGTINGVNFGIRTLGFNAGTITNSGTITGTHTADGIGISGLVSALTNKTGGTITGGNVGVDIGVSTIINEQGATIIGGTTGIDRAGGTVTNTGTITGGTTGIASFSAVNVTNAPGATISGGSFGINAPGSVTNAGTIKGGTASVSFQGSGTNKLTLQTGSVLDGAAAGSAASTDNRLILQGTGTANNNFLNFNSLDVQAGSFWVLNGDSIVGAAAVNGGRLEVGDGAHSTANLTGDVTVNSNGLLVGQGKITGNVGVMSGGIVAPGAVSGTAIGTLSVTGNTNFAANSIFGVNANSDGTASKLAVGETATLTGGSVQVRAGGTFSPSTQYTILTAAGGLGSTTFSSVTSNLAFLTPSLTYNANNVFLTLACNNPAACATGGGGGTGGGGTGGGGTGGGGGGGGGGTGGTGGGSTAFGFATVAQTRNQFASATALDQGPMTNPLIVALLNQTADGARQAFDALSGEVYGSVHNSQAEEAQFARGAMLGRMRQASYAGAPGELGALGFAGPQLAYASASAAPGPGYPVKAPYGPSRDLTFWSLGLGGWGHSDGDGNAASLTSRFGGFLSGVDARFGESWRAGFAAGYVRTDLHANDRASSAGIDSVQLGAYATGKLGAFNVRGGGSYSFDEIDASRSIFFPGFTDQTKARLHGNVGQVFGEVGYGMTFGNFALEPLAGLAYVHLRNGSFLESGGAAALAGSATHENMGYSSLGLRLASIMPLANGTVLVPRATVAWQYAFGDVTPTAGLAFQGTGTAFTVAGVPIARNSALVEGGFDWRFTPQAKLGVSYLGELAASAQTHAIKGAFTWDF